MACGTYRKGVLGEPTNLVPTRASLNPPPSTGLAEKSIYGRPKAPCQGTGPGNEGRGTVCHRARARDQEERAKALCPSVSPPVSSLLRDPPHTHTRLACHKQKSSGPYPPSPESRAPIFLTSSPSQREENGNEHLYLLSLRKYCAPVSDNTLFPLLRGRL